MNNVLVWTDAVREEQTSPRFTEHLGLMQSDFLTFSHKLIQYKANVIVFRLLPVFSKDIQNTQHFYILYHIS